MKLSRYGVSPPPPLFASTTPFLTLCYVTHSCIGHVFPPFLDNFLLLTIFHESTLSLLTTIDRRVSWMKTEASIPANPAFTR